MMEHTVTAFDDDLKFITRKVVEMGGHAESMITRAIAALVKGDKGLAESIVAEDLVLDSLQHELDERVILILAKRQPMATDLREIIGAMRMGNDLERIGDMGKNIARRTKEIDDVVHPRAVVHGLEHLTSLTLEQLKEVLDAYAARDLTRAKLVWERDEEIDALYTSLFRELLTYMMEDPSNITPCTHLLFCAKNIERVGDHATNIAEIVEFIQTGKIEFEKESHAL